MGGVGGRKCGRLLDLPCSERACPALGGEAAPNQATRIYPDTRWCPYWGGFAPQRGASPLTTKHLLLRACTN